MNTLPKQEGVRVGDVVVLAQPDPHVLQRRKERYIAHGYHVQETAHFVVCRKASVATSFVLHTFRQDTIDADLICFTERELAPLGLADSAQDYGALLFATLASPFSAPRNPQIIWRHFCLNSLARLRLLMRQSIEQATPFSHLVPFAALYQRVRELFQGSSLLDVGSCFGFLPVLLAEQWPEIRAEGCDNNPEMLAIASDLASVSATPQVRFTWQDVCAEQFICQQPFDTVSVIHLIEHLAEEEMPQVLTHLLHITSQRLILAVPYEEEIQALYGHKQIFTRDKLDYWGAWCINHLDGAGRYWCEEVMGGLLIVERSTA